jgi:multisubunit Na+/H+ antiporter MnhG subunit
MQSLAYILGRIEVIGVPLSLLGLLIAIGKQRHIRIVSALVIVMVLTVAQPFGIIATRQPA